MPNFKLIIQYDGTNYCGWQIQGRGEKTVQGEIQRVGKRIFKQTVHVVGSGRTDSKVHAKAQAANMKVNTKMDAQSIQNALNACLDDDIVIVKVTKAGAKFHAQFSAKSKTYRYTIYTGSTRDPFNRNYCLHYPHKLNLHVMREEAKYIIGRHNFRSFQAADAARKEKNTIRTLKRLTIRKKSDHILIDMEADGFLYKMVRNIVGTLIMVGSSRYPKGSVKNILAKKDRKLAGNTAPAHGLCLMEVRY